MPIELNRQQWKRSARDLISQDPRARARTAEVSRAVVVEQISKERHRLYFPEDADQIVALFSKIPHVAAHLLDPSTWTETACRAVPLQTIVVKEVSGLKRKTAYFEYMVTEEMTVCRGKCGISGHKCTLVRVNNTGRSLVVCECILRP